MGADTTYGPPSGLDAAVAAIRFMRERDCDFLTVENVCDYSGASAEQARAALEQELGPELKSQAARDARDCGYGGRDYWTYLDRAAQEVHDYYLRRGDPEMAARMFSRSLSEALQGNDGD